MSEHEQHTVEDPVHDDEQAEGSPAAEERDEQQEQDGQVSEVSAMDPADADTPVSPGDAVAGGPEGESGDTQEGAAGPDAIEPENWRDHQV